MCASICGTGRLRAVMRVRDTEYTQQYTHYTHTCYLVGSAGGFQRRRKVAAGDAAYHIEREAHLGQILTCHCPSIFLVLNL
jgi:hypothetical protein